MEQISNWFHKYARLWIIIIFMGLFIVMMNIIPLIPLDQALINNESLDLPSFNTPVKIYSLLGSYGSLGRQQIVILALTWDLLFPISYTLFFGLLISWLLQRGFPRNSKWQKANLVVLGGIFDLLENACTVILIAFYPNKLIPIAWAKTLFTMTKYCFGIPIFGILVIAIIASIIHRFKKFE